METKTLRGGRKVPQCHKHFLQYSTFASERAQIRSWGRQSLFLDPGVIYPCYVPGVLRNLTGEHKSEDNRCLNDSLGQSVLFVDLVRKTNPSSM